MGTSFANMDIRYRLLLGPTAYTSSLLFFILE